jgi:DNA polymerase I-like protein with 3'-5' exonuclease and polymerase domains
MVSLDSETTGRDLFHGAKPFLVTFALPDGTQPFCEWKVNPETREPEVDPDDIKAINELIEGADELVLQNAKFDAAALATIPGIVSFPWEKVHDTLIAAHLLNSIRPKDLTTLAMSYLGRSIKKYEDALEVAVKECRQFAAREMPSWRIAKFGLPEMPSLKKSAKDKDAKVWKNDCWLPRATADFLDYPPDHPFRTLCRDYANEDSACTLSIWVVMRDELQRRGLWDIYLHRRKILPVIYDMERRGVTMSRKRLDEIYKQYDEEAKVKASVCVNIAESFGFGLDLPQGGSVNESLRMFCFDIMQLPKVRNPKAKTDAPCLDADNAIPYYLDTLPPRSKQLRFIETLLEKRSASKIVSDLQQYLRYATPTSDSDTLVLHPSINPVGSSTLRFSFSNPNSANVSGQETKCRECRGEGCEECNHTGKFLRSPRYCLGPAPGREWWDFDAQNIELRLPAYESEEEELIALFERANEPPYYGSEHLLNFSTVYPDLWADAITKVGFDRAGPWCKETYKMTWYHWCKCGGFAMGYGAVDRPNGAGTADRTFRRPGSQARLKTRFARKEQLNQKWIAFAEKHGYVETIPDRTVDPKRGYPLICTRSEWGDISPTVPLNYHIQSSAMWWTVKAMIRVYEFFERLNRGELFLGRRWPGGYYIALQVHDELDLDMPSGKGKAPQPYGYNLPIAREVKRLMELGGDDFGGIPTPVGCVYHGDNWSEGVTLTEVLRKPPSSHEHHGPEGHPSNPRSPQRTTLAV